ncbi:MAG: c-type cytochrome biogenesis protein CcmI [Rhodobacteraceae bacterium]|nr:c-type cytochrome biogenesis protein CcmI [Paracoccaceae bacterium]
MMFWIFMAAMTLVLLGWMLIPFLRRSDSGGERRASYDMQVFRDQLIEIDSDLNKGILTETESQRSKAEISRRLLAAAEAEQVETATKNAPQWVTQVAGLGIIAVIVIGGFATYQSIGTPGARDFPLTDNVALQAQMRQDREALDASRTSQAEAEAIFETRRAALEEGSFPSINTVNQEQNDLVNQLKEALVTRPDDLEGHQMLARNLAGLQRFVEARLAQGTVIALLAENATAVDHIAHAELMINAAGGYVSPEAFRALEKALVLDASNPRGRYFAGYTANQYGYPEQAYRLWAGLLEEGPEDAPWIPSIRAQIGAIAEAAGITRPDVLRGPSEQDIEAAGDMSADEQTEMIRNMVAGLASRLANEGGPAEEWARLIGAYGVLNETERAAAIWAEAQQIFADDEGLASIRAAAISAGVASE